MQCDRAAGKSRISIHAPREGCDVPAQVLADVVLISIHAPREGCDLPIMHGAGQDVLISIHAPREGCDRPCSRPSPGAVHFNPRTP